VSASDLVYLHGGLTVPLAVLQTVWSLERRGITLTVDGDGDTIVATPKASLTDEDRCRIRQWRAHVIAVLQYEAPESQAHARRQ
jgi:hypothetical protein